MRDLQRLTVLAGTACVALMAAVPAFGQDTSAPPATSAPSASSEVPAAVAPPAPTEAPAAATPPAPAASAAPAPPASQAAAEHGFKRTPAPADAYVYIGWPNDGEVMHTTHIKVWFGTRNFGVAPAGTTKPNTGHHHLLVDTDLPPLDQPIPNDKNHLHFGLGQTETVIDLPPGKHTLQLLMADGDHVPHDPPLMSKKITIYVHAPAESPTAQTR